MGLPTVELDDKIHKKLVRLQEELIEEDLVDAYSRSEVTEFRRLNTVIEFLIDTVRETEEELARKYKGARFQKKMRYSVSPTES